MIQVSNKFKELILGPTAFEDIFLNGRILIYSGAQPASADHAATGTLLGQITANGLVWYPLGAGDAGLHFTRSGPYCTKDAAQPWTLVEQAVGVAGWFRLVGKDADAGLLSYSLPRIDGSVGTSGTDMVLASTTFAVDTAVPIHNFTYTIPPIIGG